DGRLRQPAGGGTDARRDPLLRPGLHTVVEASHTAQHGAGWGVRRGAGADRLGGGDRDAERRGLVDVPGGVLLAAAALLRAGAAVPGRLRPGRRADAAGGGLTPSGDGR